jgi:hypothetical protein
MPKYKQTKEDLTTHLREQLQFLRASVTSFDEGFEGEAKRLAATVRVLVHDTKSSKSLLHLLGIKSVVRMHDTAIPFDPANLLPHQGLVSMRIDVPEGSGTTAVTFTVFGVNEPDTDAPSDKARAKVTYVPRVSTPNNMVEPRDVSFNHWWEEIVIKDGAGQRFSRKDLIMAMANKEGGSHVDPQLDDKYAKLARFNSQGWQVQTGEIKSPLDNSVVAATVRQIAHELSVSIRNTYPDI